MMIRNNIRIISTALLLALIFGSAHAAGKVDPSKRYKYEGHITSVDSLARTVVIDDKTYKVAIGVRLENVPKKERFSGMKFLSSDMSVYFNLERGTEQQVIPTISKIWVSPN